jgi:glucan-binding YG repeat protein
LDNIDALIQAVVDGVDANATTIKTAIDVAATKVGYSLTSGVGKIFDDASKGTTDLASYFTNGDFLTKVTSISTAVSGIEQYYKNAESDADKTAASNIKDTVKSQNSTTSAMESSADKGTKARNTANKMTGVDGSWVVDKKTGNRTAWKFNDGTLATGWSKIDGKQYYFDEKGKLKTGLQTIGKNKYYIRSKTGKAVSQWQQVNKKWYYFDKTGKAVSGWHNLTKDGKKGWFYFNPKTNAMAVNSWIKNSSKKGTYYVGADGMMFINGKFKTKDGYRTFDKNGKWKGYKTGTRSVGASGLYWTNEGAPETIIRKSDGAVLTRLNSGDTVLNNSATQNMWDFANNPQKFLRGLGVNNTFGSGNNVNLEFNLSGLRSPAEFMDALRKDKRFEKLIQEMTLGRVNGHGVLAKNAIRI